MRKGFESSRSTSRHLSRVVWGPSERGLAGMPIIALVFSTLVFWALYWFVRMGGVDHLHATFSRRKEEARRAASRELERTAPLRAINDPRDAATVLMFLIARVGGDPTREQIAAIEEIVQRVFAFEGELVERMTQARFIASRADHFEQAAALFSDLFNKDLTIAEKLELVSMLKEVALLEGPSEAHADALQLLERRIGLAPAR